MRTPRRGTASSKSCIYYDDISAFRESKMAKRSRPLHVRYRLEVECSIEAEKEALTRRILQVQQLFTPPSSCLVDNATLPSATCDAVEREATQLLAPAAPTEEPLRVACHFVVINFPCVFIYNCSS